MGSMHRIMQVERQCRPLTIFNKLTIRAHHTAKNVRGYAGQRFQSSYIGNTQARSLSDTDGLNDPETVIKMFESQPNTLALSEYVKSLIKLDRLDQRNLLQKKLWTTFPYLGFGTALLLSGVYGLTQVEEIRERLGLNAPSAAAEEDEEEEEEEEEVQPSKESSMKFCDVKGVDEAKSELEEIVRYLVDRERCTRLGGNFPKGVLLFGPPATEKTMLAKAIAGEAGVPFFSTKVSDSEDMSAVDVQRKVSNIFAAAKKKLPCVIFIDEIDAICGDGVNMKTTLKQLFDEFDGLEHNNGIIVIAASDNLESLDEALGKLGRFDCLVHVPNPNIQGRRQILDSLMSEVPKAEDVDLMILARATHGFTSSELAKLVNVAALKAAMDGAKVVTMADLENAKDKINMGSEQKSYAISEESRKLTAFHEAGHALVAIYTDGAHPVHKATIVPRGDYLGMVSQLSEKDDESSISYKQCLARLDVLMGGRVAEELVFGENEVTSGASDDLEQATSLAIEMVTKYGMSKKVGLVAHNYDDNGKNIMSTETRLVIEKEVKEILERAYNNAKNILVTHNKDLHVIANDLLEHETLTGNQINGILAQLKNSQ